MADEQHRDDAPDHPGAVAHHATGDHRDDLGHDDHGHRDELLGPVDMKAWGAGLLGVLLGLAVAAAFVLATLPV